MKKFTLRDVHLQVVGTCGFCQRSHSAFASAQLEGGLSLVEAVKRDPATAPIGAKLRPLLVIAAKVQSGGLSVDREDVEQARAEGATDVEIHDTVLIAAAFCMYNRYVDGLGTLAPSDPSDYRGMAQLIVERGYSAGAGAIAAGAGLSAATVA